MSGIGVRRATRARSTRSARSATAAARGSSPAARSTSPTDAARRSRRCAHPHHPGGRGRHLDRWLRPAPRSACRSTGPARRPPAAMPRARRRPGRRRGRDGGGGERREVGARRDVARGERGVPDAAGALEARAADRHGGEVEGAVGDAGVDVHAAVVVGGLDVAVHVVGLRVAAEARVVVGRAGRRHVAQPARLHRRQEQLLADQPAARGGVLAQQPLLEADGEDVGHRLVERARTGRGRRAARCAR